MTGIGIGIAAADIGRAYMDRLLAPSCPKYPNASVFVGCLSSWFFNFCDWVGLRLGILSWPLLSLASRGRAVRWARLPAQERLIGALGIVACPILALSLLWGGDMGAFPPGGLCRR